MSNTAQGQPQDRALQAERTSLSWTRTSLAILANGVLLLLKYLHTDPPSLSLAAAGLAAVLTLCIYLMGRHRQKVLVRQPLPAQLSPRREVYAVAASVGLLILISLLSVLL